MTASNTVEPLLDLQRLATGIRRRRRMWLSFGLLFMIAGAVLAILVPPKPTAVALLLVVHEGDNASDSGGLVKTDIALLQTTRIAGATLAKLGVAGERPEDFLKQYEGLGLTNNIIQLTVSAKTEDEAVRRAQALSEVFIADHLKRVQDAADAEAKALDERRTQAEAELADIDKQIAAIPTGNNQANTQRNNQLEALFSRRSELSGQISDLTQRAKETGDNVPRITAGTKVVDPPHPVPASVKKTLALDAGGGLVIGLAFGLTFAAVSGVVRDRPVLRREVSSHLGASVIAQLPAPHRGPARLWRRSRAVAERKRVAGTLARIVRGETRMVSMLELGCPGAAAALTMDMAGVLAEAEDASVVIVNDLPGQDLEALKPETGGEIRILDDTALPLPAWPREHHIGLGSIAPGTAWTDVAQLGEETVLVVRAGHAGTLWLHTVARQLADLRVPVIGVVLVDADPKDRSDGTLWDGLHTALRGRTAAPAAAGSNGHTGTTTTKTTDLPTERFKPVNPARPAGTQR